MNTEKKVRCCKCRKVLGVLWDDKLHLDCPRCGAQNQWDEQGKRVKLAGVVKKKGRRGDINVTTTCQ